MKIELTDRQAGIARHFCAKYLRDIDEMIAKPPAVMSEPVVSVLLPQWRDALAEVAKIVTKLRQPVEFPQED